MVRGVVFNIPTREVAMKKFRCLAKLYLHDASGATAIEYGLIAAAMSLMLIPVISALTSTVKSTMFDVIGGLF
jgi:Flp pilus assembly pilin Flp